MSFGHHDFGNFDSSHHTHHDTSYSTDHHNSHAEVNYSSHHHDHHQYSHHHGHHHQHSHHHTPVYTINYSDTMFTSSSILTPYTLLSGQSKTVIVPAKEKSKSVVTLQKSESTEESCFSQCWPFGKGR